VPRQTARRPEDLVITVAQEIAAALKDAPEGWMLMISGRLERAVLEGVYDLTIVARAAINAVEKRATGWTDAQLLALAD
jgi:hypothetical protein